MMDHKYRPDGWLGFIVGSKFWIDFSEKYKLDSSSDKLAKELGNRGKIASQETTAQGTYRHFNQRMNFNEVIGAFTTILFSNQFEKKKWLPFYSV